MTSEKIFWLVLLTTRDSVHSDSEIHKDYSDEFCENSGRQEVRSKAGLVRR